MARVAIVSSLEREIKPLVAGWRVTRRTSEGREFQFFEGEDAVAVCGGIGAEAARRACQAIVVSYGPEIVFSAGFAGALVADLRVGDVVVPAKVIDAGDGSSVPTGMGSRALVTAEGVANVARKRILATKYQADAVDMEAAAVAKGAQIRGIRFAAVKAISDALDFEIPVVEGSIDGQGRFHESRYVAGIAVRPWLWGRVARLARNSTLAARNLSEELRIRIDEVLRTPANSL